MKMDGPVGNDELEPSLTPKRRFPLPFFFGEGFVGIFHLERVRRLKVGPRLAALIMATIE